MSTEGRVTTERHGHVLLIGLDRIAKRNAFDKAMLRALGEAYGELDRDPDLRAGVLFAHGDHFTTGLELTQFAGTLGQGVQELHEGEFDPTAVQGSRLTKPMVCAVQGYCWTVGIELMLATDIRIAASNTRFAQIEIKRGIYPIGGATIRFVREAGWGNAMRYLLTGDEFDAAEAYRIGLVQEIVEPGQQLIRAEAIAQTIAQQAPLGVRATLASARLAISAGEEEAMRRLAPDLAPIMQSEDVKEGVLSFVERRQANFKGR